MIDMNGNLFPVSTGINRHFKKIGFFNKTVPRKHGD